MNTAQTPLRDFRAMLATAHQAESESKQTAAAEPNELEALFQRLASSPVAN